MNCIAGVKKLKASQTFKKGTEITNNSEILDLINNRIVQPIEALDQRIYNDGTQSITIRIHYNPK